MGVWKPVNTYPGLKVNQSINIFFKTEESTNYFQKTSPKTEIQIPAIPGLA